MQRLSITGDYPNWTNMRQIMDEMDILDARTIVCHPELAAAHSPLEPLLMQKFSHLDFDFGLCFRCLELQSGWVSKSRLCKNDPENHTFAKLNNIKLASKTLYIDIVVYREDFATLKHDINAQRLLVGAELWRFLQITLPKYRTKNRRKQRRDCADARCLWAVA